MRASSGHGGTLSQWLGDSGIVPAEAQDLGDVVRVKALLVEAARERRALSYSELLGLLGHRFTRPRMRAVCRTLDAIDRAGRAAGEPELAVLVVREGDGLPGQGWWIGRDGPTSHGPEASGFVDRLQATAFDYWAGRTGARTIKGPSYRS